MTITKHEEPGNEITRTNVAERAEVEARQLAGRCANGAERDGGTIWHAVPATSYSALCGAKPGRRSAGWSMRLGDVVTCERCLRKRGTAAANRDAADELSRRAREIDAADERAEALERRTVLIVSNANGRSVVVRFSEAIDVAGDCAWVVEVGTSVENADELVVWCGSRAEAIAEALSFVEAK